MIIFGKTHRIYHEVLSHPGGKVKNPTVEGWAGRLAGGPESHRCLGLEWYVPAVLGFEKHHRNVIRLFIDVWSAVFDAYHHSTCIGSEYSA